MVQNHNNNKEQNNYSYNNNNYVNKNHLSIMQTNKPIKRVCVYVCCRSPCGGRRHNVCPQYQFGFGSSHGTYAKKIYQLKTFYKPKKKWKLLFFCLKKNQKLTNQKKVYHQLLVKFLIYLYLSVSLSLPNYQPVPITLSLYSYSSLSLSVSLCSCFTHNLCNICSYIISLLKSKKNKNIFIALKFHFIS